MLINISSDELENTLVKYGYMGMEDATALVEYLKYLEGLRDEEIIIRLNDIVLGTCIYKSIEEYLDDLDMEEWELGNEHYYQASNGRVVVETDAVLLYRREGD